MGRSIRIRYTVAMSFTVDPNQRAGHFHATPTAWPGKYVGRVSDKNLAKVVASFEASLKPGECNDHLAKAGILGVRYAEVRDADNDNKVVATYTKK